MSIKECLRTYIIPRKLIEISVQISLMGAPDCACHTGPGAFNGQKAFRRAIKLEARDGVQDYCPTAEKWDCAASGLGWYRAYER